MGKERINDYNELLRISTEEDLLTLDEATGLLKYAPITEEDVIAFGEDTRHLAGEIEYAIEEIKWSASKQMSITRYFYIYQNLSEQLTDYLQQIHRLHKKMYISLYKDYEDDLMDAYDYELKNTFEKFESMNIHKQEDAFLDLAAVSHFPSIQEIHSKCDLKEGDENYVDYGTFEPFYKNFVSTGLNLTVNYTLNTIQTIKNDIRALYRTRLNRSKEELVIIYQYIKKEFEKDVLPGHIKKVEKINKQYMEIRKMDMCRESLITILDDDEKKYKNYSLCKLWLENETEEDEVLAVLFEREQATKNLFEILFKYQGERKILSERINKQSDYEENGDDLFKKNIDSFELEKYLKDWMEANINTQEKWYIVWCLMKYTFKIVKDKTNKKEFADRMNLMFPKVEKKCVEESFRKQENKMSHNQHFSKWLQSDKDYRIAKSLYEKLKNKDEYCI